MKPEPALDTGVCGGVPLHLTTDRKAGRVNVPVRASKAGRG